MKPPKISPSAQRLLEKSAKKLSPGSEKLLELQQAADDRNFDWPSYQLKLKQHLADQEREQARELDEWEREQNSAFSRYLSNEITAQEYFAEHHPDASYRLKLKSQLAEARKQKDAFKKKP